MTQSKRSYYISKFEREGWPLFIVRRMNMGYALDEALQYYEAFGSKKGGRK